MSKIAFLGILLIALVASASAKKSASGKPEASPCVFDFANTPWFGACMPNPAFIKTLKVYSPLAKVDAATAKLAAACASYNLTSGSKEDLAKCFNDDVNKCQVAYSNDGWTCASNVASGGAALVKSGILCPDAPFTKFMKCYILNRNECAMESKCKYAGPSFYPPGASFEAFQNKSFGFADKYACLPIEADSSNFTNLQAWLMKTTGGDTKEAILEQRGTCPYGKNAATYTPKVVECNSYNKDGTGKGSLGLTSDGVEVVTPMSAYTTNVTALDAVRLMKCQQTVGCMVGSVPGSDTLPFAPPGASVFSYCAIDQGWLMNLKYTNRKDAKYVAAYRVCSSIALQWNPTACNSATLTA